MADRLRASPDGRLVAVACLLGATFSFGVIPVFLKYFTDYLDAWTVNGVRYSVGALFWLPFLLVLERQRGLADPAPASRSVWRDAVVPSIVNLIGQVCFGLSPYFVRASHLGFVLRLSFLFTILFSFLVLAEERLLIRKLVFWLGTLLSIGGVLLLYVREFRGGGEGSWLGTLIVSGAAAAWGGYAVSVRYYMAGYPVRQSFGVISVYTSVGLVVLMLLFGDFQRLAQLGPDLWPLLMISAMIGIAFGHVLYYRGIHRLGPLVSHGITLLTPFVTYLAAMVCLGEELSGVELLGGVLVVLGGCLLILARAQVEEDLTGLAERGPIPGE
ncbi:MAG: DMT family transporter [Thermoguttaceae bacterium]